jgi:hypothetical protein
VPNKVRSFLPGTVETAFERGWSVLKNGELLKAIEAEGFDLFVTADQNLRHQQNLSGLKVGIVVLGTNLWPVIAANPGRIVAAVNAARSGTVSLVEFPKKIRGPSLG